MRDVMKETGEKTIHLTAQRARSGQIILRTPRRQAIFVAGLIGMGLPALVGAPTTV